MAVRVAPLLAALAFLAACGGGDSGSPEEVVRAWSDALNSGDNEAAADLFAPDAEVVQNRTYVLSTRELAVAFNASLPCTGTIVALSVAEDVVTATFRLGHRATSRCDAPGAEVSARFTVQAGKIVRFEQLPASEGPEPEA